MVWTTRGLILGMPGDDWLNLLQETWLSFWFPFALLPFLYLVTYYSAVELAAINVRVQDPRTHEKYPLIARFLAAFRLRTDWATNFDRAWGRRYGCAKDRKTRNRVLADYRRIRSPKFNVHRMGFRHGMTANKPWDGRAMPRTAGHADDMMAIRPPGWEYLLFGAELWIGISNLATKYNAYRRGVAAVHLQRTSERGTNRSLVLLEMQLDRAAKLAESVPEILSFENQERAFGVPGTPGDPDAIRKLAARLLRVYDDMLDWAASVRGDHSSSIERKAFGICQVK